MQVVPQNRNTFTDSGRKSGSGKSSQKAGERLTDPNRAGLVRKAFELIADKDYSSAFRLVTSMGLTTRTGRPLPKQTFSRMVRNEFYAGWIVSGDVRVKGTHDPLISEDLFTVVQAKLEGGQPHQKEHEDFPLRGFLRCAGCDKALTAGWVRGAKWSAVCTLLVLEEGLSGCCIKRRVGR